LDVAVDCKW
jgi:hypothetical protein